MSSNNDNNEGGEAEEKAKAKQRRFLSDKQSTRVDEKRQAALDNALQPLKRSTTIELAAIPIPIPIPMEQSIFLRRWVSSSSIPIQPIQMLVKLA